MRGGKQRQVRRHHRRERIATGHSSSAENRSENQQFFFFVSVNKYVVMEIIGIIDRKGVVFRTKKKDGWGIELIQKR